MINFECAETLGASFEYRFLGGDNVLYRIDKTVSIQGTLDAEGEGPTGIWGQIDNLKPCNGYEDITINGCSLGSGKVVDISFEGGNDVYYKQYSATIQFVYSGDLTSIGGATFTGVDFTGVDMNNLETFAESSNYTKLSNSQYTFDRDLSISFYSGDPNSDPKLSAGILASGFFQNDTVASSLGSSFPGFYSAGLGDKKREETLDELNNTYSLKETFTQGGSDPWLWDYSTSLNLQPNGIVDISEKGNIISNHTSKLPAVISGYDSISAGVSGRIVNAYNSYTGNILGTGCQNTFTLVSKSVNKDECEASFDYDFSFSNDDSLEGDCNHIYSLSSSKSQEGLIAVKQDGSIQGKGQTSAEKFTNATGCWATVPVEISGNVIDVYENKLKQDCSNKTLILASKQITYSEYNGRVNYSYEYNDQFEDTGDENFTNLTRIDSYSLPSPLTNSFIIVNYKEIEQKTNQGEVGRVTNSLRVKGVQALNMSDYVSFAIPYLDSMAVNPDFPYLEDLEYSLNGNSYQFDISASYNFFRWKKYEDNMADSK